MQSCDTSTETNVLSSDKTKNKLNYIYKPYLEFTLDILNGSELQSSLSVNCEPQVGRQLAVVHQQVINIASNHPANLFCLYRTRPGHLMVSTDWSRQEETESQSDSEGLGTSQF